MKKQVASDAAKIGGILLFYAILLDILAYGFYYAAYFVLEGSFTLNYETVRTCLRDEHYELVTSTSFSMLLNLTVTALTVTATILVGKLCFKASFGGFLKPNAQGARNGLAWAAPCFLINMILSLLVYYITSALSAQGITIPDSDLTVRNPSTLAVVLQFAYVVVIAPVFEEVIYRGLVLGVMSRHSASAAILLSALSFGLMHGNIPQAASAFATGVVYATIAVNSGSIIPTIIIHSFNNLVANFPELAAALGLPGSSVIFSAVSVVCGIAGAYVLFTRYRFLRISEAPRLEDGSTVERTLFRNPVVIAYLLLLVWGIVERIIAANT